MATRVVNGPMHWFAIEHDLAYDLPYHIERFQQKFGRGPTILLSRDGQAAPEGFALTAKADGKLGEKEMCLE